MERNQTSKAPARGQRGFGEILRQFIEFYGLKSQIAPPKAARIPVYSSRYMDKESWSSVKPHIVSKKFGGDGFH